MSHQNRLQSLFSRGKDILLQPLGWYVIIALLVLDFLLSNAVIYKIPYTEIDWKAYMEEVELYEMGERDYTKIRGNTGPLVYPAGFLYLFSFLKWITNNGTDILRAQQIFLSFYLITLLIILALYSKSKVPTIVTFALILSKRVHSIFMLRMFNDCLAALSGYVAIYFFIHKRWRLGSVMYSFAVSIKMNMLLYAPGVLAVYLLQIGGLGAAENMSICAIVQLLLGYPFLSTYPLEYLMKAFELSRVFFYKWTVNYKFLPEEIFLSKELSIGLLIGTVLAYVLFAWRWTAQLQAGYEKGIEKKNENKEAKSKKMIATSGLWHYGPTTLSRFTTPKFTVLLIFISNFIGIVFARTIHYQFYSWYFHTLPFLLYTTSIPWLLQIVILLTVEICYNVYPATWWSSLVLQICHLLLLIWLYFSNVPFQEGKQIAIKSQNRKH